MDQTDQACLRCTDHGSSAVPKQFLRSLLVLLESGPLLIGCS